MMSAPHALMNLHTNETGCQSGQSEVALNSSFWAEIVTPLLTEDSCPDLSQIHSFDGGTSSVVAEGWDTCSTNVCCRLNQTSTRGPKLEKRNVRESENYAHTCEDLTLIKDSDCLPPFVDLGSIVFGLVVSCLVQGTRLIVRKICVGDRSTYTAG